MKKLNYLNFMKKSHLASAIGLIGFLFFAIGSNESETDSNSPKTMTSKDLVGKKMYPDGYHVIEFTSTSRYHIFQKPYNCGGDGSWSIKNDMIVIGSNSSNCESTKEISGQYKLSDYFSGEGDN